MTQIHFCFRRINPALSIDLCSIGTINEDRFVPLDDTRLDALKRWMESLNLGDFICRDTISTESYVHHDRINSFLNAFPVKSVDFFQDSLIVVVELTLDGYVTPSEEK